MVSPRTMKNIRCLFRRPADCEQGVAAIEAALIVPILVVALVCTTDLGMGIYRKMQVQNAAQAGAEYAVTHGFTPSAISSAATAATSFSAIQAVPAPARFCGCPSETGVTGAACDSNCSGGVAPGTYVTVSTQATYNTILPYPAMPRNFVFTAQSTVRIQ